MSGLRHAFLLGVCTVGRVALGLLKGVSIGIPQRVQIFVSAQILTKVGDLLINAEQNAKTHRWRSKGRTPSVEHSCQNVRR